MADPALATQLATPLAAPFGAGVAAGLGVAIPLGPIAVLIVDTGLRRGWRPAAAAGLGAGTADLAFAAVAVVAGGVVATALAPALVPLRIAAAALLGGIAVRGLAGIRRRPAVDASPAGDASGLAADGTGPSLRRTWATLVGLTAVNPTTLVYFAALAVGLPALGGSAAGALAFVVGVGISSAAWQLVLASAGALLRRRLPARARVATALVGNAVILVLAASVLIAAVAGTDGARAG